MFKTIKSLLRELINHFYKLIIKDGKNQKQLVVTFYNLLAFFDTKKAINGDIFNYKAIIYGKKQFRSDEYYRGNSFYGVANTLREYADYHYPINACIEHGVYFGDYIDKKETQNSGLNAIITFGKSRLDVLKEVADVPIIPIGPYINYAVSELSDREFNELKCKLGKSLLVFPDHSMDRVEAVFDSKAFISCINKVKLELNIDTVIICLYWKDIILGRDDEYLNEGFKVVTAGYQSDVRFLKRLRAFIELSSFTMSNAVGTHVGYCVALNKPHFIYSQDISYEGDSKADLLGVTETYNDLVNLQKHEVMDVFSSLTCVITEKQREVVNKYWGLEYFRNKLELYDIFINLRSKGFDGN